MKGIAAVANILKMEGVEYLFCFPNTPLIEAAAALEIRPILTRMERTLVNMADGYTRVLNGRRTGVCTVQYGPGIENAFPGVAQAYADSVPILILPGAVDMGKLGLLPDFSATQNYAGVTKWVDLINSPDRVLEMMRRAFTYLRTGKPGPVMLEMPRDVADADIAEAAFNYRPVRRTRSQGDPQDVAEAAKALLAARSPIIHVGQGVLWAEASEELREFAELVQAPVVTTTLGKSAFPEDHPLSVGVAANTGTAAAGYFLRKAELVFGIGSSFHTSLVSAPIPPGKTIVQCVIDESDLSKEYPADYAIIGDAKLVLRQLLEEVKKQASPQGRKGNKQVAAEVKSVKEEWLKSWMPKLTSDEVPINPYRVVWEMMRNIDPRKSIVTHDSGHPRDQIVPFYQAVMPRGYIGWGNSTQLGSSLGLAMGAKLAAPDKTVVNLMGDAAFGMAGMDFETAVRERIPILTILVNNGLMGGYPERMPIATERYGSSFLTGNYTQVAKALGGYGERIEKPQEIAPAIQRALKQTASGRPALLEIITREEKAFSKV